MSTIIIKNETNQGRFLEDLGIYIDATSELTLSDIFTIDDISDSKDLEDLVNSETLIVNNGVNDLDRYSGLKHINLETVYEDDETEDVIISDTTSTYTTIQVVDNGGGVNINVVTPIAAPFNAEICKDSDVFTHSNLTNNSRITVEETGLYKISYSICWSIGTANDANVRTRIRKNGDTYIAPSTSYGYAINPDQPYGSNAATVFVSLSADDYIEIMCDRAGDVPAATTLSGTSQLFMELY